MTDNNTQPPTDDGQPASDDQPQQQRQPTAGVARVETAEETPGDEERARKLAAMWLEAWEGDRRQSTQAAQLYAELIAEGDENADRTLAQAEGMVQDRYPDFEVGKLLPPNYTGGPTGDESLDKEFGDAETRAAYEESESEDGGDDQPARSGPAGRQTREPTASRESDASDQDDPTSSQADGGRQGQQHGQQADTTTQPMSTTDENETSDESTSQPQHQQYTPEESQSAAEESVDAKPAGVAPDADLPEETKSAQEAGLKNDDGEFAWLEDATETEAVEQKRYDLGDYKGTHFACYEPADEERYQNHFEIIEGIDEESTERQKRRADRFARELANDLLYVVDEGDDDSEGDEVDETPVMEVWHYKAPDGTNYEVHDPDGLKGVGDAEETERLWDAMRWFDRNIMGNQIREVITGEKGFQRGRR